MTVEILESAAEDIIAAGLFYGRQGGAPLKEYFRHSIFAEIDALQWRAGICPVRHGYRCALVRNFPYSIYFRIEDGAVRVRAVVDTRRDPDWIVRHLA